MNCTQLQPDLALYTDGFADDGGSNVVKQHLDVCPVCRHRFAELREVRIGLRQMRRPEISTALKRSIKQNVAAERQTSPWPPLSPEVREWLMMRLMPYGVGVMASLTIGVTFLTALFSGAVDRSSPTTAMRNDRSMMVVGNADPFDVVISPSEYAQTRLAFANESPSINPQGSLIAMTRSLARNSKKDDEVVVVADIYSNGSAQIAEVVEPSRNTHAVAQLEKALYTASAASAFVPAAMENRPESVRVVLKFQTVDVKTDLKRSRL